MYQLHKIIEALIQNSNGDPTIIQQIRNEDNTAPFSEETRLLAYLLSINAINYDQYNKILSDYMERYKATNRYLYLFDMAPRTFGQTWGEQHILSLFPQFIQATKENLSSLYPTFNGEFDLWIENIRIEVKACRANNTRTNERLSCRAYSHAEAKSARFKYHFQQLKPSCCDVFIWIGVCKDELLYWVITSNELLQSGKLGSQHRNENTGIQGTDVFEGQVFMTEEELSPYAVAERNILQAILQAKI